MPNRRVPLKRKPRPEDEQQREYYLTRAKVAEIFDCSVMTVMRLEKKGVLKPVRLRPGGRVLFAASNVYEVPR